MQNGMESFRNRFLFVFVSDTWVMVWGQLLFLSTDVFLSLLEDSYSVLDTSHDSVNSTNISTSTSDIPARPGRIKFLEGESLEASRSLS